MAERLRGLDGYSTCREAVDWLMADERCDMSPVVWEPAYGLGALADALVDHGRTVYASDVHRWRRECRVVQDFLRPGRRPPGVYDVVTNPPFYLAHHFARVGMRRATTGRVWLLLKLAILQGGRRYYDLFEGTPPRYVYVFVRRVPRMHVFGYDGPKSHGGIIPMAWLVFDRGFVGEPKIRWVE